MPIKGMTDNVQPRLPRLGKLRKGGEKTKGGYGPDLDHFRFTSEDPEIMEAFKDAYGEAPKSIEVYLPYATPEEAFPTWCELWSASGLQHRCDGENMVLWLDGGKYQRGVKKCSGGHENGDPTNDAVGRLDVIIPELIQAGFVGYVTLETHSKNDVLSISATLKAVYESRGENPLGLRGILFNLRRVQENISTPGWGERKGQRSRTNKWLVKIEPAADWVRLQLTMSHAAQMGGELPMAGDVPLLPEGDYIESTATPVPVQAPASTPAPAEPAQAAEKAPKPASTAKPPKTAAESQKPAGKPSTPADMELAKRINELGEQLWPGCWVARKQKIGEAYMDENGQVNMNGVLQFLEQRQRNLAKLDQLRDHVAKSWPGLEGLIDLVVKEKGEQFDRVKFLAGLKAAAEAKAQNAKLELVNLLDVMMVEMDVPAGF